MADTEVVITGLSLISGAGATISDTWRSILEGRSAVHTASMPGLSQQPVLFADVPDFEPDPEVADSKISKFFLREDFFAASSARMAIRDADLQLDRVDMTRGGLFVASGKEEVRGDLISDGMGACMEEGKISPRLLGLHGLRLFHPLSLLRVMPNTCQFGISALFGFRGPNLTVVASGAAGAQALGEAFRAVQQGECDFALAGAEESRKDALSIAAFQKAGLLSNRIGEPEGAMRPFDMSRDGFALGEGAGFMLLESVSHAKARGAPIRARIAGYGSTKDTDSNASGMAQAIKSALGEAALDSSSVGIVFPWGDCTINGDLWEAKALRAALGPYAEHVPICCVKPVTGNMLAASSIGEAVIAILAMQAGVVPPTINHDAPDSLCRLGGILRQPLEKELRVALCLSRGLHGQNVALVLETL